MIIEPTTIIIPIGDGREYSAHAEPGKMQFDTDESYTFELDYWELDAPEKVERFRAVGATVGAWDAATGEAVMLPQAVMKLAS